MSFFVIFIIIYHQLISDVFRHYAYTLFRDTYSREKFDQVEYKF